MLEEARFEDRLHVEIDAPNDLLIPVPTLILQPIVENAVKHGAMKRPQGIVRISISFCGSETSITISDNGYGIPETVLQAFYDQNTKGQYGLLFRKYILQKRVCDMNILIVDGEKPARKELLFLLESLLGSQSFFEADCAEATLQYVAAHTFHAIFIFHHLKNFPLHTHTTGSFYPLPI
ncbi:MAG: sensor histidine kinase [Lachnospiraceae bacterium]